MKFKEKERIFTDLCSAVRYIHKRNIIHRDLKPENIFLTKDGHCKLGDFGNSKVMQNSFDLAQTAIGTRYYAAPEVINGQRYDKKADIWSLGLILYELFTLKPICFEPDLSLIESSNLKDLLKAMLSIDPSKRPSIDEVNPKYKKYTIVVNVVSSIVAWSRSSS